MEHSRGRRKWEIRGEDFLLLSIGFCSSRGPLSSVCLLSVGDGAHGDDKIKRTSSQALVQALGPEGTSYLLQDCVRLYLVLLAVRPG